MRTQQLDDPAAQERLLQAIRQGWTERLAARFEAAYGRTARWQIIVHMERLGLLQSRVSPERVDCLSERRLELYENTLSDLWMKLMKGLVAQYLERREEGRIQREFAAYLSGVVRHLVVENARALGILPEETPNQLLRLICEAKQAKSRHARLAWAKYCLEKRVRAEILSMCSQDWFSSVYSNLHHISDYFFERYIPERCDELCGMRGNVLAEMLRQFTEIGGELELAATYCGQVTPYSHFEEVEADALAPEGEEYTAVLGRLADKGWR